MKQIVFVTISMAGGGTERVISVLANYYIEVGYGVTILMIGGNEVAYDLSYKIDIRQISAATNGSLLGRLERIKSLRNSIRDYDSPYVIAMGTVASMFTSFATIGVNCNLILSERNDPNRLNHKPISKKMKMIREFLYGTATRVVLQTEDSKSCFGKKVVAKSTVIMNPLPKEVYERRTDTAREKTIVASGRLIVYKGYELLISAFAKFSKIHENYKLKIFGKGELQDELQKQIDDLNIADKATLCGFSDDMYSELIKGGMYVSSSISEGVSNALMEALALGIPVIATDCPVGGSRMCIENEVSGILIDVGDEDNLVKNMCRLAENAELCDELTQNAMKKSEEWTVESVWDRWMELFA